MARLRAMQERALDQQAEKVRAGGSAVMEQGAQP